MKVAMICDVMGQPNNGTTLAALESDPLPAGCRTQSRWSPPGEASDGYLPVRVRHAGPLDRPDPAHERGGACRAGQAAAGGCHPGGGCGASADPSAAGARCAQDCAAAGKARKPPASTVGRRTSPRIRA